MSFKMKNPPYKRSMVPVYTVDMDESTLGMAQSNGTILINKNTPLSMIKKSKTIEHEMVHIEQMKRGDLDYNDKDVIWKGKKYPRSKMKEGSKKLPWEKEAYRRQ
jgi:hypothetical protein